MESLDEQCPYVPLHRPHGFEPPPELHRLARRHPVTRVRVPTGQEAWLVSGHVEVRAVLTDRRFQAPGAFTQAADYGIPVAFQRPGSPLAVDGREHSRLRNVLKAAFSSRKVTAMRPRIKAISEDLLDDMAHQKPPVDLHQYFSSPLPVTVVCEMLDVPVKDRSELIRLADSANVNSLGDQDAASRAWDNFCRFLLELVERRKREPSDDLISQIAAHHAADGFPAAETATLIATMIVAGHQTTAVQIEWGVLGLLQHPAQHDHLLAAPQLLPQAVEEIVRSFPIGALMAVPRFTTEDVVIAGTRIKARSLVLASVQEAGFDSSLFDEPQNFDIGRRNNPHLAFGYGPHYCTGAALARLEIEIALGTLFQRFPSLHIAVPLDDLQVNHANIAGGLVGLPVAW
ncbi:cytochrome P450 [Streptomyces virginiae]|uniref:cytochrome P450 n=1 Tax=Streptomyces virginiae TaxID=1961 RepID=UPI0036B71A74